MAEQVQALMERMVAPLRDLRDRGIFSEVSQSVSSVNYSIDDACGQCLNSHEAMNHLLTSIIIHTLTIHLHLQYSSGRNPSNSNPTSLLRISPPENIRLSLRLPPLHRGRDLIRVTAKAAEAEGDAGVS